MYLWVIIIFNGLVIILKMGNTMKTKRKEKYLKKLSTLILKHLVSVAMVMMVDCIGSGMHQILKIF